MAGAVTFLQFAELTTDLTIYTHAAQNFGTASPDRYIIACIHTRDTGAGAKTVNSVTIGGVAASIVVQRQGAVTNSNIAAIAIAAVPSGTSGDVVVTFSEAVLRCGIELYSATDISGTPHDTDSAAPAGGDPSVSLDIPAGGIAIGCGTAATSASAGWTGLTERNDQPGESSMLYTSASDAFASLQTGLTITINFSANIGENCGAFASFGPAVAASGFGPLLASKRNRLIGGGLIAA